MEEKIEQLKAQASDAIRQAAANLTELDEIRVKFLGKKGEFTSILRGMGALAKEDRPKVGKIVNEAKVQIEALIAEKNEELKQRALADKLASEKIDVTLPGRTQPLGHLHPLTLTLERIKDIFFRMGFSVEEGPEIEKDYFNFESLNLPKDHPARDMQDSFYITEDILMRSQTSPVQARTMQK
ncbi:MAG: phenylalanine--tRNA ligase subunit alpha, partial [Selenomonas sp.]|nr:phenylalanine--tRNA ligase subunit alpha [Selenomonas sp.]